jgi:Fe-S cluster assembly iron-binding protein IscA
MITTTRALKNWLESQKLLILTEIRPDGCKGYKLDWKLIPSNSSTVANTYFYHAVENYSHVNIDAEIDYINTPLFSGIHVNLKNKDKCGCGVSFS